MKGSMESQPQNPELRNNPENKQNFRSSQNENFDKIFHFTSI